MTLPEFTALVKEMRAKQKEFFSPKRTENTLGESVTLERRVDKAIREIEAGPPRVGLFDPGPDAA